MAAYRIYRMKEQASQQFRWAPHVSGATQIKRKDYDEGLRICKYVGFDAAQWIVPEVKTGLESAPVAAGPPQGACEAV